MTVLRRKEREFNPWYFKFKSGGKLYREYGFATRAEAEQAEAELRVKLKKLTTRLAFSVAVYRRLESLKARTTPKHFKDNIARLRYFADWRDLMLDEITVDMITDRITHIANTKTHASANKALVALKSVFQQAFNEGVIAWNPCRGIEFFGVDKKPKLIPTKDQISQVLLLAKPMDRAYLITVWLTAARVGEVNDLTWEDVDLERRTIRLWTRKKRRGERTPRSLEMTNKIYESIKYAWRHRDPASPYVFTNPRTGKKFLYRYKMFRGLCQRAGVPWTGYHALRHYAASALADANVPITAIQAILGHEAATTTNIYLQALGKSVANGLKAIE